MNHEFMEALDELEKDRGIDKEIPITDGDGKRLETVEQAEAGKRITVRVKDGRIGAVIDHVEKYR